jgi:hypothetical protein
MLRAVTLVAQWDTLSAGLPDRWSEAGLRLRLARPEDAHRAAVLLGPLSPGVSGDELHLRVTPVGTAGPSLVRRLFERLDAEHIGGTLELAGDVAGGASRADSAVSPAPSLAAAWDELAAGLPGDWSDLLCLVELRSTDELAPAALALAPVNPSRHGSDVAFRFRVAREFGYGAAPGMARRCLARLDESGIPGRLRLLEAFSDTRPVFTQGPTFVVSDRAV